MDGVSTEDGDYDEVMHVKWGEPGGAW